jgi:hypothetical protein
MPAQTGKDPMAQLMELREELETIIGQIPYGFSNQFSNFPLLGMGKRFSYPVGAFKRNWEILRMVDIGSGRIFHIRGIRNFLVRILNMTGFLYGPASVISKAEIFGSKKADLRRYALAFPSRF